MHFNEYQKQALTTDLMSGKGTDLNSTGFLEKLLGLVGETGELADKFKKILRDEGGVISDEKMDLIKKELGDVLWYLASLSDYLGFELEDVAQTNIEKLASRQKRGKLGGAGDSR